MTGAQVAVFDDQRCALGEGPIWHPERKALFWFDILGKALFAKGERRQAWQFDEYVSAAGWVDHDTLLMASATGLWRFDICTGARDLVVGLEADNAVTRSNDGRADPQGGFWIGTMGVDAEAHAGAIYRYYRGELRRLFDRITISNAICFAPDGQTAYFTDTFSQRIQRVALDADGWPTGAPEVFIDLRADGLNPDGCVVDAGGNLWNAQWGVGRVACYDADGVFQRSIALPASQTTCPAFDGTRMFVTSAAQGVDEPQAGMTFEIEPGVMGQREHQVIL
ncbi:SMP-30/gluconolactonase/LRE family protein [uncultured Tateyamaria sp.]|uniref:SMP-30/gluconolactonase/LRE family protein n=1 Tax=uncultured Tateyamaria sp. TaxID=455651 RepID=UPI002619CA1A|nr:SMP-30/gluconolactonase/LRE family protein [uncultured Tateyamaria sp.]